MAANFEFDEIGLTEDQKAIVRELSASLEKSLEEAERGDFAASSGEEAIRRAFAEARAERRR